MTFDEWAKDLHFDRLERIAAKTAWEAAQRLYVGGCVPDGWKLVPIKPTLEMYAATEREWDGRISARVASVWEAMLKAAPQFLSVERPDPEAKYCPEAGVWQVPRRHKGGPMIPCVEQRFQVGRVTVYLQCNLLSCLFGLALFTNSVQIAIGPLCAMIGWKPHDGDKRE